MDFEILLEVLPMVAQTLPFGWVQDALTVMGGAALLATGIAKDGSQYKTKAGKLFGTLLNIVGGNFGRAKNKG